MPNIGNFPSRLGSYEAKSYNTTYQAETDGFVVAYIEIAAVGDIGWLDGKEGPNDPPDVVLARDYCIYAAAEYRTEKASITFPVAKDRYWRVDRVVANGAPTAVVHWIPLS